MLKISTRGQYALLIMTDLAEEEEKNEGAYIPLKTLSHRRNLFTQGGDFMIVGGEEGLGMNMLDDMFDDGLGDCHTIKSSSTTTDFIK